MAIVHSAIVPSADRAKDSRSLSTTPQTIAVTPLPNGRNLIYSASTPWAGRLPSEAISTAWRVTSDRATAARLAADLLQNASHRNWRITGSAAVRFGAGLHHDVDRCGAAAHAPYDHKYKCDNLHGGHGRVLHSDSNRSPRPDLQRDGHTAWRSLAVEQWCTQRNAGDRYGRRLPNHDHRC